MDKIFSIIRVWLERLGESGLAPDPLDGLSIRELADLPAVHPLTR